MMTRTFIATAQPDSNILRSAEDSVVLDGDRRMETFVMHVFDSLPPAIAQEYDAHRRRLDLYCGLFFVAGAFVVPSVAIAAHFGSDVSGWERVWPVAVAVAVTDLARRAAVASTRTLALVIYAIGEVVDALDDDASDEGAGGYEPDGPEVGASLP